jgi:hypothetical protein
MESDCRVVSRQFAQSVASMAAIWWWGRHFCAKSSGQTTTTSHNLPQKWIESNGKRLSGSFTTICAVCRVNGSNLAVGTAFLRQKKRPDRCQTTTTSHNLPQKWIESNGKRLSGSFTTICAVRRVNGSNLAVGTAFLRQKKRPDRCQTTTTSHNLPQKWIESNGKQLSGSFTTICTVHRVNGSNFAVGTAFLRQKKRQNNDDEP